MNSLRYFTTFNWLLALLLWGCSSGGDDPVIPVQGEKILLSAGMAVQAESRGAGMIDADYASALGVNFIRVDQNASTGVYPSYSSGAVLAATRAGGTSYRQVSFDAGSEQYYPVRESNNKIRLTGWYPRVDGSTVTYSLGVVNFSIDGSTDIMLTGTVEGSKDTGSQFSDAGKEFTFNHLLTQLRVKAYATDAASAAAWGTLTDVKVKDRLPFCKVTLPSTVVFEGSASSLSLVRKKVSDNTPITYPLTLPQTEVNATECGYAMVNPVNYTVSAQTLVLEVSTLNGGTRDVALALRDYEQGKAYVVSLKFTATGITAKAQIGQWTTVNMTDIEL